MTELPVAEQIPGRYLDGRSPGVPAGLRGLGDHPQVRPRVRPLRLARGEGAAPGADVNTQIHRRSMPQLPELMERIIDAGARNWQIQLTVAMGRAADNPEVLLQPYHLKELMPMLARLYQSGLERGLVMQPGNNIGYFGPYERLWRGGARGDGHRVGCNAGQNTIGLEADGTIKGCPSLPSTDYSGGNIRAS